MRAFYRVPTGAWPVAGSEAVLLERAGVYVYVLAAHDPDPALEAAGAKRLGSRLSELTDAQRARVTNADGIPRTVFAGDDPADYR